MKIGFASDIHRLVEGRELILSGVIVPFDKGELAHSDGDVVYHALAESMLGALALGDLGTHFPDSDPKYKNINSALLVEEVIKMVFAKGYEVGNVDISITLEKPKLKPFIGDMCQNIAKLLRVNIDCVSVKAGTNEGMGDIGKGEAVKAESIVLLKEKE